MEEKREAAPHPGIRPEMAAEWVKYEKDALENEPGEAREYALTIVRQVSRLVKALDAGIAPLEAIKLVEPNTSFVMMSPILQSVCAFSVRGEEFRKWWNQWHGRVHPDDSRPRRTAIRLRPSSGRGASTRAGRSSSSPASSTRRSR